jgi:hypothetical protein
MCAALGAEATILVQRKTAPVSRHRELMHVDVHASLIPVRQSEPHAPVNVRGHGTSDTPWPLKAPRTAGGLSERSDLYIYVSIEVQNIMTLDLMCTFICWGYQAAKSLEGWLLPRGNKKDTWKRLSRT